MSRVEVVPHVICIKEIICLLKMATRSDTCENVCSWQLHRLLTITFCLKTRCFLIQIIRLIVLQSLNPAFFISFKNLRCERLAQRD